MSYTAITDGEIDIGALRGQLETFVAAERNHHNYVGQLLNHIEKLNLDRNESVKELRASVKLARTYQSECEEAEAKITELQRAMDCDMFVLILIDGDNTLFQDEYIKDGLTGGERAARDLHEALFDHFKNKSYFKHDHKMLTRIYLNQTGLSKTYSDVKTVPSPNVFQQFVQGFNKMFELMVIIDAGNGKEAADSKVKAEFTLFRRNLQCKQIVLAGSGDNSYGGFLRQYTPSSGKSETVTLIEALPFAREMQYLSDRFDIARFENIFRETKIITRRVSFHEDVKRVRTPPAAVASASPAPPATPPMTWATKASSAASVVDNGMNGTRLAVTDQWHTVSSTKPANVIYVNDYGARIDKPIRNLDKDLAHHIKQRKLCNRHYLGRNCPFRAATCTHDHKPTLNQAELDALRSVARLKPCDQGVQCRDSSCTNGHRCLSGTSCFKWKDGICWFTDAMHEVDLNSVNAISIAS